MCDGLTIPRLSDALCSVSGDKICGPILCVMSVQFESAFRLTGQGCTLATGTCGVYAGYVRLHDLNYVLFPLDG